MTAYMKLCAICVPGCCHHVRPPITRTRQQLIDRFLQDHMMNVGTWLDTTTYPYAFPRETVDGACIFFDFKLRTCLIHAVKPETCRAGPITFDLDISQERILWFMKSSTDCLLASALRRNPMQLAPYLAIAKQALRQLIHALEPFALRALLRVPEPFVQPIGDEPFPDTLRVRLVT
jgi:Fe-S-cluster containining protein